MAPRDPRTHEIIGAAIEVHGQLGCGFHEKVYQQALEIELENRGIPHRREAKLPVSYKGKPLDATYLVDFICYDAVVVELKAQTGLTGADEAQVINYLRASGFEVGLLFNFGETSLQWKRLVLTQRHVDSPEAADSV